MRVVIETIDHNTQRYNTVGDWWWEKGETSAYDMTLQIRVSYLGSWRQEMAVAYHEMFEALVCRAQNITQQEVDEFDAQWKEHDSFREPGDDPAAPYHDAHQLALAAEHIIVAALGTIWGDYAAALDKVSNEWVEKEEKPA